MAAGLQEASPTQRPGFAVPVRRHRAPLWTKICLVAGAVLLLVSIGTIGSAYALSTRYEKKVKRAQILTEDTASNKETVAKGPLNFLILGSDNRAADPSVGADTVGQRSDTIMLVHVNEALSGATVVSIPRDSYVDIPPSADGKYQGGKDKINAAYALGGPQLTATTVHDLTGVDLDGAFILDFDSVRKLVGIVGGVWVDIPFSMSSYHTDRKWKKGRNFLTADAAQDFMRQRYSVPGGDFGRIQNQQRVMMAVAQKLTSKGILTNPLALDRAIATAAGAVTADESVNIRDLALALRNIRPSNLTFATVPYASDSFRTPNGSSAVKLDDVAAAGLFQSLQDDTVDQWLAANPQKQAGSS